MIQSFLRNSIFYLINYAVSLIIVGLGLFAIISYVLIVINFIGKPDASPIFWFFGLLGLGVFCIGLGFVIFIFTRKAKQGDASHQKILLATDAILVLILVGLGINAYKSYQNVREYDLSRAALNMKVEKMSELKPVISAVNITSTDNEVLVNLEIESKDSDEYVIETEIIYSGIILSCRSIKPRALARG